VELVEMRKPLIGVIFLEVSVFEGFRGDSGSIEIFSAIEGAVISEKNKQN
jgi:hypothetical protein